MENFLSCFRLAQCYVTINSVKQQWPYIFSQFGTQSGESGNTLKIKCSGTADERANIFLCQQRAKPSAVANVRWATLCLTLTKQAFRKDDSVERKPTILAHSTAKENDKRMVKSFTSEHRPKRKVHIQQNPSEVSEGSNELAIEAEWRRPRLRSRKRGGGTATPLFVYFLNSCKLVLS